jgi:DNA-directed RNA polymerase subunit RPC12/RpoP
MTVDVYCKKCNAEGFMDLYYLEDGVYTEAGVECPECGGRFFGFTSPLPDYEGL